MTENNDYSYLLDILKLAEASEEKDEQEKLNLKFSGDLFSMTNTSKVNLNLAYILLKDTSYNTVIDIKNPASVPSEHRIISENLNKSLSETDFIISHNSEPSFLLPDKGNWIIFQNWDFGSIPLKWVEAFSDYVDEIWVSSQYNKNCFVESYIPEEKIRVINSGVDSLYFNPHVEPQELNTKKKIKFLYKGNLEWQTGFDLLFKAYIDEFVRDEDVCLVIETDTKNISQENTKLLKSISELPDAPEIQLVEQPNDDKLNARLYKSCNYLVSPYRSESYCLDILESMACGVPAIVSGYGAALDYCNNVNSIMIKASRVYQSEKRVMETETKNYPYWSEIEITDLRFILRKAFEMEEADYNTLSKNASKTVMDKFTWIKINDYIKQSLQELKQKPVKREKQHEMNLKILAGLNAMKNGEFNETISLMKEAYGIDSENPVLNFYLANIYMSGQDYNKALEHIYKSVSRDPDKDDYINLMGIILFKLKHYNLARSFFNRALFINPEYSGAKVSLKAIEELNEDDLNNTPEPIKEDVLKLLNSIIKDFRYSKLPTLSVCILSKNEQRNIENAINSVKTIADEIIVLDTGSTDKTISICKNMMTQIPTLKLHHTEWKQNFATARNEAMELAKMDWIFMLDADEVLTDYSVERFKPTLFKCSTSKIYLPRIINIIEIANQKEQIEHYVARIIPNQKNIRFIRSIHEYPVNSDGTNISSENLKGLDILHFGYSRNIVAEKNKIERNREILLNILAEEPDNPINHYYLSENYKDEKNFEKVYFHSSKVIELCKADNQKLYNHILIMSKLDLIQSLLTLERYGEGREKATEFTDELSERPDFWFLYGNIEFLTQNYDKAIEYQKKALSLRDKDFYPAIDMGTVGWKPLSIIAKSYKNKEDYKNAILFYKRAIKESLQNLSLFYDLTKIYCETGELEQMEENLKYFLNVLKADQLSELLKIISSAYFEKNMSQRLYKLLEKIRIERLTSYKPELNALCNSLIEIYIKVLENKPDLIAVKYSIACCYSFIRKFDEAKKYFEEVLESDELDVDSIHNLASIAISLNNFEKAEELYKKVLDIDEFHTPTYLGIAKLELGRGNIEEAIEYLNELKTIDPDNKEISHLEFEIASKSGDKKLASDMYAAMLFRSI